MKNQSLNNFPIAKGTKFIWNSTPHEILGRVNQDLYQVEYKEVLNGIHAPATKQVNATELIKLYKQGHIRVILESEGPRNFISGEPKNQILWDSLSNEEKAEAYRRLQYIVRTWDRPLTKSPELLNTVSEIAAEIQDKTPPSFATLANWRKFFKQSGMDMAALGPKNQWKGNRQEKYCEPVRRFTEQAIEDWYLRPEKMTIIGLQHMVIAKISYHNELNPEMPLPYPGREYIRNKVRQLSEYSVSLAKHGKEKTYEKFKVNRGTTPPPKPLEQLEMDHTPLDVMAVNPVTGVVIGRPTLTVIIDVATRCIVGFYITMDKPGFHSVQKCLLIALQKKDYIKTKYPKIQNTWDCFGQFNLLVVDGGREFHSNTLEDGANQLGVTLKFNARRKGQEKPHVERVQGTINQFCHTLPGTTFSNIVQKGDYDPVKNATLTLDKLDELIHTFIIDVYHQTIHSALGMTPSQAWQEQTQNSPVYLNHTQQELEQALSFKEKRTLGNKGISLHNIHYRSDELERIRQKNGSKVSYQIRYNPDNLDTIELVDHLDNLKSYTLTAYSPKYCHLGHSLCLSDWQDINKREKKLNIPLARAYASLVMEAQEQERPKKSRSRKKSEDDRQKLLEDLMRKMGSAGYGIEYSNAADNPKGDSIFFDNTHIEVTEFPIIEIDSQK